jgi:hypothetical protein
VVVGTGQRFVPGQERSLLDAGEWIRHRGWRLSWRGPATLEWPVYPYNPYADAPETSIEHAVAALTFRLQDSGAFEFRLEPAGK